MLYQFSKLIRSEYQISLVRKLSLVPTALAQQNLLMRPLVRDELDTLVPTRGICDQEQIPSSFGSLSDLGELAVTLTESF